ncbi:hypothetical protein Clacol_003967 [Clathrus columnatus]|uniref:Pre-rRNA-processing protein n=1 Tax=Clathrus columnatus TaxID=1419009 RepID=A0AAV5A9A2_9AGAM|nr:hypothetical protein Clacol_003967 [Clathrus columnatus]
MPTRGKVICFLHWEFSPSSFTADAITGLQELLEAHPALIESSLTTILHSCARVISDEDADVRKLLINLFAWLLRTLPVQKIQPHIQFLMLFITSAQTNIFPAIRIDAIRFIDILLELVPDIITQNWLQPDTTGSRVLEGYLGLLNTSSKFWSGSQGGIDDGPGPSTASVTLSTNSRLTVLSSLATFLEKALLPAEVKQTSIVPKWILAPYFSSERELHAFCNLVYPCRTDNHLRRSVTWDDNKEGTFVDSFGDFCCVNGNVDIWLSSDQVEELIHNSADSSKQNIRPDTLHFSSSSNSQSGYLVQLARTLQPILTSTWLDVASSVFAPTLSKTGNETETLLAITVMRILGCLFGYILRSGDISESTKELAGDDLYNLLSHISPYLPNTIETNDLRLEEFIRSMSFSYCELASLAAMARIRPIETTINSTFHQKRDRGLSIQLEQVGEYIVKTLDGQFRPSSRGTVLSTSSYITLLPTLWHLTIHRSNNSALSEILSACIDHSILLPSKSALKAPSTQFIGIFTLLCDHRNSSSQLNNLNPDEVVRLKEWYQQLPKTLWEAGTNDSTLTEVILLLLLRIPQRQIRIFDQTAVPTWMISSQNIYQAHLAVMSRLMPYFTVIHPQKGKLPGPFSKLKSSELQKLALDVAKVIFHDQKGAAAQFRAAVEHAIMDMKDASYWLSYLSSENSI